MRGLAVVVLMAVTGCVTTRVVTTPDRIRRVVPELRKHGVAKVELGEGEAVSDRDEQHRDLRLTDTVRVEVVESRGFLGIGRNVEDRRVTVAELVEGCSVSGKKRCFLEKTSSKPIELAVYKRPDWGLVFGVPLGAVGVGMVVGVGQCVAGCEPPWDSVSAVAILAAVVGVALAMR